MFTLAEVPSHVAGSMVAEGRAEVAQQRRGAGDIAHLVIEVLGATANAVTILVATREIKELITRTRRENTESTVVVHIRESDLADVEIAPDAPLHTTDDVARAVEAALEKARQQRKLP